MEYLYHSKNTTFNFVRSILNMVCLHNSRHDEYQPSPKVTLPNLEKLYIHHVGWIRYITLNTPSLKELDVAKNGNLEFISMPDDQYLQLDVLKIGILFVYNNF